MSTICFMSAEIDILPLSVPLQLVLEGVKARQLQNKLLMDKRVLERDTQQANLSFNFYGMKAARIEDQVCVFFALQCNPCPWGNLNLEFWTLSFCS